MTMIDIITNSHLKTVQNKIEGYPIKALIEKIDKLRDELGEQ